MEWQLPQKPALSVVVMAKDAAKVITTPARSGNRMKRQFLSLLNFHDNDIVPPLMEK